MQTKKEAILDEMFQELKISELATIQGGDNLDVFDRVRKYILELFYSS